MAQFNHPNVLSLLAIVTDKQPNMCVNATKGCPTTLNTSVRVVGSVLSDG
jgi:hypothetical protein